MTREELLNFLEELGELKKKTILCPPNLMEDVQNLIDKYGLGKLYTVVSNEYTGNKIFIIQHMWKLGD